MLSYSLSIPTPSSHYLHVELGLESSGAPFELMMAVWTPGSYMLREFARHVEGLGVADCTGAAVPTRKASKNRWALGPHAPGALVVRYRVYCHEMTVRTSWIEADFALLNGASIFVTVPERRREPHAVEVALPHAWRRSVTSLPRAEGGEGFTAPDFDALVDSPILLGNPALYEFSVRDKPHTLANVGEGGLWDGAGAARDLAKIVETAAAFWGELPYERYVFHNLITEGRGGLEHAASTVLMTSRWAARLRKDYVDWLGLAAHEHFHAWNVKRLRPVELGPFDYEREAYTRSLWVAEGFTAYYDDLLVHRAGLSTRAEYLERLSKNLAELAETPGRQVQSLVDASHDAWIKYYRPDENSPNSGVSYYVKGAVVAFLLDAKLRARGACLDDVLRLAYRRYAGERGYSGEELGACLAEVHGEPLDRWLDGALRTTSELDYEEALATLGLRAREAKPQKEDEPPRGYLGVKTKSDAGRLVVTHVLVTRPLPSPVSTLTTSSWRWTATASPPSSGTSASGNTRRAAASSCCSPAGSGSSASRRRCRRSRRGSGSRRIRRRTTSPSNAARPGSAAPERVARVSRSTPPWC